MNKFLILLSLLIISNFSIGQVHQKGPFSVKSIRYGAEGVQVAFSPAPPACNGGNKFRMHAEVKYTQINSNVMISALIAAYTANQTIKYIWVSNEGTTTCSSSHILNLDLFEMSDK